MLEYNYTKDIACSGKKQCGRDRFSVDYKVSLLNIKSNDRNILLLISKFGIKYHITS